MRLALLFLAVISASCQTSKPVPRNASDTKTNPTEEKEHARANGGQTTPNIATSSNKPTPGDQREDAPGNQRRSQEQSVSVTHLPDVSVLRDWFDYFNSGVSILLFGVGLVGIGAAICTLREIRKQTQATRDSVDAFIASERPWLSIEVSPAGDIRFDQLGIVVEVTIKIKNIGKTPACRVDVEPLLYCVGGSRDAIGKRDERICALRQGREIKTSITVLPGAEETIPDLLLNENRTRTVETIAQLGGSGDGICATAIICVAYGPTAEKESIATASDTTLPYYTGAVYNICRKRNSEQPEASVIFLNDPVPIKQIILRKVVANGVRAG